MNINLENDVIKRKINDIMNEDVIIEDENEGK